MTFPKLMVEGATANWPGNVPVPVNGTERVGFVIGANHEASSYPSPRLRCKRNAESHALSCAQGDRQVQAAGRERGASGGCRRNRDACSARVSKSFRQCLGTTDLNAAEAEAGWVSRELARGHPCARHWQGHSSGATLDENVVSFAV